MLEAKSFYDFSQEERFQLQWYHLVRAMYHAHKSKNEYDQYLNAGEEPQVSLDNNMLVSSIVLSKLGYPMDAFGTYLYAEIIAKTISEYEHKGDIKQVRNQVIEQSDQFFLPLLKDKLDIREQDFTDNIKDAIDHVDADKMDISFVSAVYDGVSNALEPLENAVVIADYIYTKKQQKENHKTKKLVSMHK